MAQLKDTVVSGSLRATDSLLANTGQFSFLKARTSSSGSTIGEGTAGYALMSGGSNSGIYWGQVTTDTSSLLSKTTSTAQSIASQVTFNGKIVGKTDINYGTTLPTTGLTAGQIFFQITDPYHELPDGGTQGQVLAKKTTNTNYDVEWKTISLTANQDNQNTYYVCGQSTVSGGGLIYNTNIRVENGVLLGAAWNDYAEYRLTKEKIEAGRCIIENGDGSLSLSTDRLQAGAEIVSDTFGFAIGQTEKCNTPIAVSGRVLAYMNEPFDQLRIGAPVCSGPNGTVSQMTNEEASQYPWLIIGTISSIPEEKEWGKRKIKTNGRIWIRVR